MTITVGKRHFVRVCIGLAMLLVGWLFLAGPFKGVAGGNGQNLHELKAALSQNLIVLGTAEFIDKSSPVSAEQHKILAANLKSSSEEAEKQLGATDKELAAKIREVLSAEKNIADSYAGSVDALYKVLSYNPEDDLAALNPDTQKDEIKKRATAAGNGLDVVLKQTTNGNNLSLSEKNIKLGDATSKSLQDSRNCFEGIGNDSVNINQCVSLYEETRIKVNEDLITSINTGEAKNIKSRLQQIITELNYIENSR